MSMAKGEMKVKVENGFRTVTVHLWVGSCDIMHEVPFAAPSSRSHHPLPCYHPISVGDVGMILTARMQGPLHGGRPGCRRIRVAPI